MKELYLDNAATTKVYDEVIKDMEIYMKEKYGNPSSVHNLGQVVRKAIDDSKKIIADEINARPEEIIFTSGATESNNLALFGLAKSYPKKKMIIISSIEHPSINEPCEELKKEGYTIIKIPVDKEGIVSVEELDKILKKSKNVLLVSIMHVNNIFGTIQPIEQIGNLCKKNNVFFHTDSVQGFGKLNIDVKKMNVDLLSASAHKIGGPKGIGMLYVKSDIKIKPLILGGGQERNTRSGTENVPGIAGFVKALEIIKKINKDKIKKSRDELISQINGIGGKINGSIKNRIYNNVHVSFPGIESSTMIEFLSKKEIYVSSGSACESKKKKEDDALKAIGLSKKEINGSIRITLNENIREREVYFIVQEIKKALQILSLK